MNVRFLQIEPTSLCNLNCTMCSRTKLEHHGSMSLSDLSTIVEQVPDLRAVKLQGLGEPMLAPEIIPMMRYLKSRSIRVYTAMNGTILPDDLEGSLGSVDRIEYSIDSLDPGTYRRIRRGGNLRTTVENLERLCREKQHHPGIMISINSVILDPESADVEDFFVLAERLGIDGINFNVPQNWSVSDDRDSGASPLDLDDIESRIAGSSNRHGVQGTLHRPVVGYSECKWARIGCYITWNGFVTPCCQRPDPAEINFGNVFRQSLRSILQSPRYIAFRESLTANTPPPECLTCSAYISEKAANEYPVSCQS